MDRVGRIVVPKPLRDALGIGAETELEIELDGTALRLEPRVRADRQIIDEDGWPVLATVPGAVLTDDEVRALRDADQR